MAKKRAPGAGRKPRGEFQGKSAVLTTRITPETRAALERAAKGKKRSLSQVAEKAIDEYLRKHKPERGNHIRALGEAIMLVALYIERDTGQRWTDDAFTGEALRQGCTSLIAHFAPRGTPVTPKLIKEAATRVPPHPYNIYTDTEGVGKSEAGKVITSIESWNLRKLDDVHHAHFPEEWYTHAQLLRDLGSGWKRAQGRKK